MSTDIQPREGGRLAEIQVGPMGARMQNMADYWTMAKAIVSAGAAPKGSDTASVFISLQAGAEVGLPPIQSVKFIRPINNIPTIWGDAPMALCLRTGKMAAHRTGFDGEPFNDDYTAWFEVERRGVEGVTRREFSVTDAKKAGLWAKQGPWQQYPKRMLFVRARAFALRDAFPDALGGLSIGEEMDDVEDGNDGHASRSDAMLAALQQARASVPAEVEDAPALEGGSLPPEPDEDEAEAIRQADMAEAQDGRLFDGDES